MDLNLTTEAVVSSGPPNVKVYGYGTLAVLLICILSILGIVVYPWLPKKLNNMVMSLMGSLAVGALAGDALFHLIPTSLGVHGHDHGKNDDNDAIKKTVVMVSGIYSFYLIDIIMTMLFSNKNVQHSHHHGHHEEAENELPMEILTNDQAQLTTSEIPSNKGHIKKVSKLFGSMKTTKSYGWSVLLADTIHNFADGIAIGAAFSTDLTLGLTTTFAIALHEIPHELGDYAILLQAGFSHIQAVVLNFLTAFTSLIGLYMAGLDEFIQTAQGVIQRLDQLHKEHDVLQVDDGVLDLLRLGEEDASVTTQMVTIMQLHEADRQRLRLQVSRLNAENQWLREEISRLRSRYNESEQERVKLEIEMDHLKFNRDLETVEKVELDKELPNNDDGSMKSMDNRGTLMKKSSMCMSTTGTGTDIPPRLKSLHNIVLHYASQGRYEVAVPLCRQTLDDLERNLGHDHPDVAAMLNILALVYRDQNKYKEATQLLKDALAIREKTLGPDSLAVAATLNNLAVLNGKRGKYKDARMLCEKALKIREGQLGADHPDIAKQLTNLAFITLALGDMQATESCYERALDIYKNRGLNGDRAQFTKACIALAQTYGRQNKLKEAESVLYSALDIKPCDGQSVNIGPSGQSLSSICSMLASIYRKQGLGEIADRLEEGVRSCNETEGDTELKSILTGYIALAQMEQPVTSSENKPANVSQLLQQLPSRFKTTMKRFSTASNVSE